MVLKYMIDRCLKNSQFQIVIILSVLTVVSCLPMKSEQLNTPPGTIGEAISLLKIENQCLNHLNEKSQIYSEVENFIAEVNSKQIIYKGNLFDSWTYDFQSPLVVNEEILKSKIQQIKNQIELNILTQKSVFQLEEMAKRYEGKRCSFKQLAEKQSTDLRPYLNLIHKKDINDESLFQLCSALDKASVCATQINIAKRTKNIDKIVNFYTKSFEEKIFNQLFMLRKDNNKFNCTRNEDLVEMQIDVYSDSLSSADLGELLDAISSTWSKNGLKINFQISPNNSAGSLKIATTDFGISFVSDEDPMKINLAKDLDLGTLKRVVAHEFGHILGFPDCYIEFYNPKKSELVYYEISENNFNIMCSIKNGSKVEVDYIEQIKQNSCKF